MMAAPKHLEWVYIYVGEDSGSVGYVGRSKNAKRCAERLASHRREEWYSSERWIVYFCPCLNRNESESIETELINRHNAKWNKDKRNWGTFLEDEIDINKMPRVSERQFSEASMIATGLSALEKRILKQWRKQ